MSKRQVMNDEFFFGLLTKSFKRKLVEEVNVNAYRASLLKAGYTNGEIDNAIKTLAAPYKPVSTGKKK